MIDLTQLFSSQKEQIIVSPDGTEISGLSENSSPENCKILGSFKREREPDRRFYLVEIDDYIVLMRICKAMEGSGYDEFAVIRSCSNDDEEKRKIIKKYNRWSEI